MDLIVLRNSIFCHSAGALCPSQGPDCSKRGPYQQHSGCGIEELSSASNQTMRKNDREKTGVREMETGKEEEREKDPGEEWREWGHQDNPPDASTLPHRHKPHTLTHHMCTCSSTHK
ncbi:Hypothetical predicted protein [Scomber scombrus]|uniref:Uncharacterized protein n=1 Tax=Scomber scombrus TaxID=13677 RepID=A0AAV1MTD3_SCOSC